MFLKTQKTKEKDYYKNMLATIGSLSRLFSESTEPYIAYRIAENLFCRAFGAKNLSRGDITADASLGDTGFGIKTFGFKNGKPMEKVAEFNKDYKSLVGLSAKDKILKIAELRNERIITTMKIADVQKMVYHCVTREKGKISIFEEPMNLIDIKKIRVTSENLTSIFFKDGADEYKFSLSKSTLYKRFIINKTSLEVPVQIMKDPFDTIEKLFKNTSPRQVIMPRSNEEHVYLPLYSEQGGKNVGEQSGLNQWNAKARFVRRNNTYTPRNINEAYIPIPSWIHKKFPKFFPEKNKPFNLHLPSGNILSVRTCQANSKALMSNPNEELGKWLLRGILNLKEGELLTYEKLEKIGLDSVIVYKIRDGEYGIDFTEVDSYEDFKNENKK